MFKISNILSASAILMLSACASNESGYTENVKIDTYPRMSAQCLIENEHLSLDIALTPSNVDVARANGPLSVTCKTPDGWHGHKVVESTIEPGAVAGAVATGAVATGVVMITQPHVAAAGIAAAATGAAIGSGTADAYTGAAFRYPQNIVVPMEHEVEDIADAVATPLPPDQPPAKPTQHRRVVRRVIHKPAAVPCSCDKSANGAAQHSGS